MKALIFFLWFSIDAISLYPESLINSFCTGQLKLLQVVVCVLHHSPEHKTARLEIGALQGKKKIASYIFPSNPYISISQAARRGNQEGLFGGEIVNAYNGEILLSQEIFFSAQRSVRMKIANSELSSAERKLLAVERDTIAEALSASILYQYAKEEVTLFEALNQISEDIFRVIKNRAEKGLTSPIEADLAESELLRARRSLQIARRNREKSKIQLAVMMGVSSSQTLDLIDQFGDPGYKKQTQEDLLDFALRYRPEVESFDQLVNANTKKLELLYKEKVPNPIISAFVQKDGFNETVMGGRVSMPLRIWRDQSGEIQEGKYRVEQSKSIAEVNRHTISLEVLKAHSEYESLQMELESYSPLLLKKVESNIEYLKKALMQGQVNLKEALILQQSFLNLKVNYLGTRLQYALSGVELLRASGSQIIEIKEIHHE
jgi:outer membrane protein, heavy metal efflux system